MRLRFPSIRCKIQIRSYYLTRHMSAIDVILVFPFILIFIFVLVILPTLFFFSISDSSMHEISHIETLSCLFSIYLEFESSSELNMPLHILTVKINCSLATMKISRYYRYIITEEYFFR
jgi:ABC-type dipeptide/oligopeptide/nickel transport system permease subunit